MLADVTSVLADITSDCSVQVYATDGLLMATPPPLSIVARAPSCCGSWWPQVKSSHSTLSIGFSISDLRAPSPSQIHGTSSRFS